MAACSAHGFVFVKQFTVQTQTLCRVLQDECK